MLEDTELRFLTMFLLLLLQLLVFDCNLGTALLLLLLLQLLLLLLLSSPLLLMLLLLLSLLTLQLASLLIF